MVCDLSEHMLLEIVFVKSKLKPPKIKDINKNKIIEKQNSTTNIITEDNNDRRNTYAVNLSLRLPNIRKMHIRVAYSYLFL